jgi:CheY-like chemotaxis protein
LRTWTACKVVQLIRSYPRPEPPLILAYSGAAHREAEALAAGCDAFILKPNIDELERLVQSTREEARAYVASTGSVLARRR